MGRGMQWLVGEQTDFARLGEREQMLLDLLRRWLSGWETRNPDYWEKAWRLLLRRFSPSVSRGILAQTELLVRQIAAAANRNFSFNRPCCGKVTEDERWLLDLLTAPRNPELYAVSGKRVDPAAVEMILSSAARLALLAEAGALGGVTQERAPHLSAVPANAWLH